MKGKIMDIETTKLAIKLINQFNHEFDNRTILPDSITMIKLSKLSQKQLLDLIGLIDRKKVVIAMRQLLKMMKQKGES
tara:strand:- start:166 stop:399 length:234 start_codon:yes stop_codon:yes gene_type:complete